MSRAAWFAAIVALWCAAPSLAVAAPPESDEPSVTAETAVLQGRVRAAGAERAPVVGAVVMLVDAPPDVRPGKPAREPLDPEAVTWMLRAETDAEGRFTITEVPVGTLRIVVVAAGHERLEQWARLKPEGGEVELHLEPEQDNRYRTEVASERDDALVPQPELVLDGQTARHYPGSRDDPLVAAMNLPGVARSPGGLGMVAFRGADPTEVGVYLDGHPIPRAFHVLPIAAVLAPPLVDHLELSPGNYPANYGGFGGGLVTIASRVGKRDAIHGQAHLDLFDTGATIEGPVGKGSINLGVRRSHVGDVLRLVPVERLTAPNYWDYFARFDQPLGGGHGLVVRALGAGDRMLLNGYFDMRASFHRFDFDYRFNNRRWQILVSPSVRLDATTIAGTWEVRRHARVYSGRIAFRWQPRDFIALDFGADVVGETWRRQQNYTIGEGESEGVVTVNEDFAPPYRGEHMRFGAWFSVPLRLGNWSVIPSLRANVFAYGPTPRFRVDPRVSLRGPLRGPVQLLAAVGMYAIPVFAARDQPSLGYLGLDETTTGDLDAANGRVDLPQYIATYFDPGIGGEVAKGWTSATHVTHASLGFEAKLPWDLELRALGFGRSSRPVDFTWPYEEMYPRDYGRRTSMGLELLLRRTLGVVDGWLGYTLLWARVHDSTHGWLPAIFDQRHNFVALLSFALPRNFRFGVRFRLGSGNPETPVTSRENVPLPNGQETYLPIHAPRGTSYQPLFHQLDLRLDKTWIRDRTTVGAYFDVQNVYNHLYPEIWIYSADWTARQSAIGLPIYPSIGVIVSY